MITVSAALGIALTAGAATAASAVAMTPASHVTAEAKMSPAGGGDGCGGLIIILCN